MQLSEKIVFLRKHKGMSQEQLATELDVSRQAVYKWETGITTPEIEKLKRISEIFDVSFDDLLNDKIDITNTPVVSTNSEDTQPKPEPEPEPQAKAPVRVNKLPIIISVSVLALLAAVAIIVWIGVGNKHWHDFDKYAVDIAPTCTTAGIERRTCKSCGYEESRSIATISHSPVKVEGRLPTCSQVGLTEGSKCSVCQITLAEQAVIAIAPNNHVEEIVPGYDSTCTVAGLSDGAKCAICGITIKEREALPLAPHTEETVPGYDSTCTKTGLTDGAKCSACKKTLTQQQILPVDENAHTPVVLEGYAPTCTVAGLTDGIRCSECGTTIQSQKELEPSGHSELHIESTAPTCSSEGLTDGVVCSVCDEPLTPQSTIPIDPSAHNEEPLPAVSVTCLTNGMTAGVRCTLCKKTLVQQTVITAKGYHTEVPIEGKAATCTEGGLSEGKMCSDCNEVLTAQEVISAKGHLYSGTTCLTCGAVLKDSVGLEFTLNEDTGTYKLTGLGSCTDLDVVVPAEYNGLPVTELSFLSANSRLISLNIPDSVTDISSSVISKTDSINFLGTLEEWCQITISNSPSSYYKLLINGALVEELVIPDSVAQINSYAFACCSSIRSVDFNNVKAIEERAFYDCKNLSTVKIGSGISKIGVWAFFGTAYGKTIIFEDQDALIGWLGTDLSDTYSSPIGSSSNIYIGDTPLSDASLTVPSAVNIIYPNVLRSVQAFASISFELTGKWFLANSKDAANGTVIDVTDSAKNAELLSSTYAGYYWKRICPDEHTEEIVPGYESTCTVAGLSDGAKCAICGITVKEREALPLAPHTEETVPGYDSTCAKAGLSDGAKCAICGISIIQQEVLPILAHTYVHYTCSICNNTLTPSQGLEFTINSAGTAYSFTGLGTCSDVDIIVPYEYKGLPVNAVGSNAIDSDILRLVIPSSVTKISLNIFSNTEVIEFIGSLEEWCNISFTNLSIYFSSSYKLKMNGVFVESVVIPDSVSKINAGTFAGCSTLKFVDLNNTETIGAYAFRNCSHIETIKINSAISSIGTYAFGSSVRNVVFKDQDALIGWLGTDLSDTYSSPIGSSSNIYIGDTLLSDASLTVPSAVNIIYPNVLKSVQAFASISFELTGKWFLTNNKDAANGTVIDVTDSAKNAELLSSTYAGYYWKRICPDVHTEEIVPGYDSTCTVAGLSDGTKCAICGITVKEREALALAPHTEYISKVGYDSTCTKAGLSDETSCSVCSNVLTAQDSLDIAFHNLENGSCTFCGTSLIFNPASFNEGYAVSLPETLINIDTLIIPSTYNGKPVSEIDTIHSKTLTTVFIPGSVKRIYSYAFKDCSSLENVTISEGVVTIGGCAFCDTALKHIYIPASVEEMRGVVFEIYSPNPSVPHFIVDIYCGAEAQPEKWNQFWYMNYYGSNSVSWGVTYEEYLSYIS